MKNFFFGLAAFFLTVSVTQNAQAYIHNGDADIVEGYLYCPFSEFVCFHDGNINNTEFRSGGLYEISGYDGLYRIYSDSPEPEGEEVFEVEPVIETSGGLGTSSGTNSTFGGVNPSFSAGS